LSGASARRAKAEPEPEEAAHWGEKQRPQAAE
jgi:hypothetical protein